MEVMTPSSLIVKPILTRPKTTNSMLRNASLRNIYGRHCSYTLLGEKKYLRFKDRPLTSASTVNPCSSSTPTVPFSTADLLYNSEVSRPGPSSEDYSSTDLVYYDRDKDKHKLRDIDSNRRPSSRNNSRRSVSLEKVSFDGEKEELRPIKNTFPTPKQNQGRANGVRGALLRNDQLLNHKNNVSLQGREPDDLVAMGTIWSPNLQQRNSTTTSTTTSSKSFSLSSSSNTSNVNPRKGPSATITRTGFPPNISTVRQPAKDSEPKYTDPLPGASPSFQQRLMELSALEAETVRWERTKKVKKKTKQDRDS